MILNPAGNTNFAAADNKFSKTTADDDGKEGNRTPISIRSNLQICACSNLDTASLMGVLAIYQAQRSLVYRQIAMQFSSVLI
jgi:hypothetical protein